MHDDTPKFSGGDGGERIMEMTAACFKGFVEQFEVDTWNNCTCWCYVTFKDQPWTDDNPILSIHGPFLTALEALEAGESGADEMQLLQPNFPRVNVKVFSIHHEYTPWQPVPGC